MKILLALWGGLMGALAGGSILAMAGAYIFTEIYGAFEGAAAMGGFAIGSAAGAVLGFAAGMWLMLRKDGERAGTAAACLTGGGALTVLCFVYIAFS